MREIPSREQVLAWLDEGRNWGRWGDGDQRGALNLITADKRVAAAGLVRSGQALSLSRPFPTQPAPGNPRPAQHFLQTVSNRPGGAAAIDFYGIAYHGLACTHLDALGHTWNDDTGMWGGRSPRDHVRPEGLKWCGIENWADGIMTRGVLLDVPRHRGEPFVTADRPVHGWELEEVAAAQGVVVEPGDALLVCSGRESWAAANPHDPPPAWVDPAAGRPGLHASCLPFVREHDVAVLAWDQVDLHPSGYDLPWTMHAVIHTFGVAIIDNVVLEPLATACADLGRYDFMFFVAPLRVIGGTGSPVNPIAVL